MSVTVCMSVNDIVTVRSKSCSEAQNWTWVVWHARCVTLHASNNLHCYDTWVEIQWHV